MTTLSAQPTPVCHPGDLSGMVGSVVAMTEDLRAQAARAIADSTALADPDYPAIHLAPPVGRLNDPNGLLIDGDTAHAFYQFTPMHPTRRLVFWGHASSRDLTHWEQHEPAIIPDSFYDANGAYSGNAIILEGDELEHAPADAAYQLFFTGNLKDRESGERTASQNLVTSPDLKSFTKWPSNPLIPTHQEGYTAHYRDPQVVRDPRGGYRMAIGAQRVNETGTIVLYRSQDLLTWEFEGELSFPDAGGALDNFGFMWECPGIIRLTDEATGEEWDVLIMLPQGAQPDQEGFENIYPCVYLLGHLEGTEFRDCDGAVREVDRGFEFYAPQVFARRPSEPGEHVLLGWAGNAEQDDQPSIEGGNWVHLMTLARRLSLRDGALIQRPITKGGVALEAPATLEATAQGDSETSSETLYLAESKRVWRAAGRLENLGESGAASWRIGDADCHVDIRVEGGEQSRLIVDRSTTRYAQHGDVRTVSLPADLPGEWEIIHDRSITEVYLGDGALAFTLRSYLAPEASGLSMQVQGATRVVGLGVDSWD